MDLNTKALKKTLAISLVTLALGSLGLANEVTMEIIPDNDIPAWVQSSGNTNMFAQNIDAPTIEFLS